MSEALEMLEEIRAIFQGHPGMKQHGDIFEKHLLSPIEKELKAVDVIKKNFIKSSVCSFDNTLHLVLDLKSISSNEAKLLESILKGQDE